MYRQRRAILISRTVSIVLNFLHSCSLSVVIRSSQSENDSFTDAAVMSGIPFCSAIFAIASHNLSKESVPNSGTRSPFLYRLNAAADTPDKRQISAAVQDNRSIYSFNFSLNCMAAPSEQKNCAEYGVRLIFRGMNNIVHHFCAK